MRVTIPSTLTLYNDNKNNHWKNIKTHEMMIFKCNLFNVKPWRCRNCQKLFFFINYIKKFQGRLSKRVKILKFNKLKNFLLKFPDFSLIFQAKTKFPDFSRFSLTASIPDLWSKLFRSHLFCTTKTAKFRKIHWWTPPN